MESVNFPVKLNKCVLALGPESDGNFSFFRKGVLYRSDSFGNLLNEENFQKYNRTLAKFLKDNGAKPDIILTDLHPFYKTTLWGEKLSLEYKAKHIKVQHHVAHIFSAIGDKLLKAKSSKLKAVNYGIACDGTGYGLDENIWGGEIFKVKSLKLKVKSVERIGHLENHALIGGDLAVKEPARMLIAIMDKFMLKEEIFKTINVVSSPYGRQNMTHFKKPYGRRELEILYSQLKQNFNCQETSSTGRILDAVSVLLGFSGNVRKYKHGPTIELEKNSTLPYAIKPKMIYDKRERQYILQTTSLFEYLIKNIKKNKKRLAATAQFYIAQGLYEIIKKELRVTGYGLRDVFFAGGIANNKIISGYLEARGVYANKYIPRGDTGISFGQIIYYLLANPRH